MSLLLQPGDMLQVEEEQEDDTDVRREVRQVRGADEQA